MRIPVYTGCTDRIKFPKNHLTLQYDDFCHLTHSSDILSVSQPFSIPTIGVCFLH